MRRARRMKTMFDYFVIVILNLFRVSTFDIRI